MEFFVDFFHPLKARAKPWNKISSGWPENIVVSSFSLRVRKLGLQEKKKSQQKQFFNPFVTNKPGGNTVGILAPHAYSKP